jgi:hypothetical protein
VDKALAVELLRLAEEGTESISSVIGLVKQRAPGHGADFFASTVSPIWGDFISGFMSPVWDRHPELRPTDVEPTDGGFDPDAWNLPKQLVIDASHSLTRVQGLVPKIKSLVEGAHLSPAERQWFDRWLERIETALDQAQFNVASQHPDFRGPEPKEAIPAPPSNDELPRTRHGKLETRR